MNAISNLEQKIAYTTAKATSRAIRVWLEGKALELSGFPPLTMYSISYHPDSKLIMLNRDRNGKRKVTNSSRNGKSRPIIDLHSNDVANVFSAGERVKVTFSYGMIRIELHHEDVKQTDREARIKENAKLGK